MAQITGFNPPERNLAMEKRVEQALKQIDNLLGIRWVGNVYYNSKYKAFEGRYALICQWPSNDPRWPMHHRGELGEPFDILGWFAKDPHDAEFPVEPESIWNRVLEVLSTADNAKTPWKVRMKNAAEKNKALKEKNKKDFLENQVHDIASYERNRAVGAVSVNVPKEIS